MRAPLTDVSHLEGERVTELLLDRQVPLIDHGGPEVLIKYPDSVSRVAAENDALRAGGGAGRTPETIGQGAEAAGCVLLQNAEWQVHVEFFVAASAFHEFGDSEPRPDYCFAMPHGRGPGNADSRQPISDTRVVVIKGLVGELRGSINAGRGINGTRIQSKVHRAVVYFSKRSVIFEAQAEIYRQIMRDAPVILRKHPKHVAPKFGGIAHLAAEIPGRTCSTRNVAQPEVG